LSETEFGLMGTSKSKSGGTLGRGVQVIRILWRPHNRGLVLTAIVVLVAVGLALYAWRRWGEPATHSSEYVVTPERILVTPQPTWIHTNVKGEVVRSLGGARLDLLDRELVEQVAEAFALHPWVAKVVRVEKRFPAQVNVDLEYRRPVIVVKIDAPGEQGLLFLDEESVLLPSADFAPSQAKGYLRIMAAGETPTSVYGTPWGSERILGAARVAAAWGNRWQALGLYWIVAARQSGGELMYELRTQDDQVRVVWGLSPGHESTEEASVLQKIKALEQYVHEKGPLDKSGASAVIDLRELTGGPDKTAAGDKAPRR
jgi:hypothetical protein